MAGYGLLGRRLGHSRSPEIHAALGSVPYGLYEVEPENVGEFLRTTELSAMNVTIPYKKTVVPFCVSLSPSAKALGSVNTLVRREDGWHGYNTDYDGFLYMAEGMEVTGKKVLVLGSGGASVTVCAALRELGARDIRVISRSGEDNYENLHRHRDADLVVNTTPVGMYPDTGAAPVDLREFSQCRGVLDLIYNPIRTALLLQAEEMGIPHRNGLSMLVAQAKAASEHFTGRKLADDCIPKICRDLEQSMKNIILVGMPGCGKSTVAQLLARQTGRPLWDADAEIEKAAGMTIPELFAARGESGFREVESAVLRELGKKTGGILATGGGCVTREENFASLRQNGLVIWLRRDLQLLPTEGRPLSQKGRLEEMYRLREPLYRRFCHLTVDNDTTPESAAEKILEAMA